LAPPPKGQTLTSHQRAFAEAWIAAQKAGKDLPSADIAAAAGYSGDRDTLGAIGRKTIRNPAVLQYLREATAEILDAATFRAALAVHQIAAEAKSERVRADAALRLLAGRGLLLSDASAGASGPALVLNLHLPGTPLPQAETARPVIDGTAGPAEPERSRIEGEHALAVTIGAAHEPEGGAGGGGGGFRDDEGRGGGSAHGSPPITSGVGEGGGGKVTGEGGLSGKNPGSENPSGRKVRADKGKSHKRHPGSKPIGRPKKPKKRKPMSAEAKARASAALKARWAERGPEAREAARARLVATKARVAAAKAGGEGS
jgi:hypothetical protein